MGARKSPPGMTNKGMATAYQNVSKSRARPGTLEAFAKKLMGGAKKTGAKTKKAPKR